MFEQNIQQSKSEISGVKPAPGKLQNPFAQQATEEPKPEAKPAPKKLNTMNWVKDDEEKPEEKPKVVPKKVDNSWLKEKLES